jgi:hypothetical protein
MALGNRFKSAPGAGTLAALILVLVFGSPWFVRWVDRNTNGNTAGGWWLRVLAWPRWSFNSNDSLRTIIVDDLRAILVILLTALFLRLLLGSQLADARGTVSQFFVGWAGYIFAGGFAALLAALFLSHPSLLNAFRVAGTGASYGLFVGWIVGLATLGGRRGS